MRGSCRQKGEFHSSSQLSLLPPPPRLPRSSRDRPVSHSRFSRRLGSMGHVSKLWPAGQFQPFTCFCKNLLGNTPMRICLHIVYGGYGAGKTKQLQQRPYSLQSLTYLLAGPWQKEVDLIQGKAKTCTGNSLLRMVHVLVPLTNADGGLPGVLGLRTQQWREPIQSFASQSVQFPQALLQWPPFNSFSSVFVGRHRQVSEYTNRPRIALPNQTQDAQLSSANVYSV